MGPNAKGAKMGPEFAIATMHKTPDEALRVIAEATPTDAERDDKPKVSGSRGRPRQKNEASYMQKPVGLGNAGVARIVVGSTKDRQRIKDRDRKRRRREEEARKEQQRIAEAAAAKAMHAEQGPLKKRRLPPHQGAVQAHPAHPGLAAVPAHPQ